MILDEIIAHKRAELQQVPRVNSPLQPSDRSLAASLSARHTGFIMECKKASPSRGTIRADFDPATIATSYAPFADGISVLIDRRYFSGDPAYLTVVSQTAPQPVLCKEFIVDPNQIRAARSLGADAVLLMLSVLGDADYRQCAAVARELAMDILTEVHTEDEMTRAIDLGARIIGINNRNLKNLEIDLTTTERLAPMVPADRLLISESGIRHHRDVKRLAPWVNGFLVGSSLMSQSNLDAAVRRLVFGEVKVCGLTRIKDAQSAWTHGATWGGMIFFPKSPRYLSPQDAGTLVAGSPQLNWVGVFVNEPLKQVAELANRLNLAGVQLHGTESPEDIARLRSMLVSDCEIWTRWSPSTHAAPPPATPPDGADRIICDTHSPTSWGGTGQAFDWSLIESVVDRSHLILAGGLNAENAAVATELGCGLLDISSALESSPGVKDPKKISAFFEALRGTARRSHA